MPAREQMQMDVKDRLAGFTVAVQHGAIPALVVALFGRDRGSGADELSHERLILDRQIVGRRNVFPRHDQHVKGRLRVDVVEREEVRVLEHLR